MLYLRDIPYSNPDPKTYRPDIGVWISRVLLGKFRAEGHRLFPHPLQCIVLFSHNPTMRR